MPSISIIIPVYREGSVLTKTLERLVKSPDYQSGDEVIIVQGEKEAAPADFFPGENVKTISSERGRGLQMNAGARIAKGELLLFLHADTQLPLGALDKVRAASGSGSAAAGSFSLGIDSCNFFFRFIEAAANIRCRLSRVPYGDQGIFIKKDVFEGLGGYRDIPIMEDADLMIRLKRKGFRIKILGERVETSARRWETEGYAATLLSNRLISVLYRFGVNPARLLKFRPGSRRGIIVFIRYPEAGKVKTRLGDSLGGSFTAGLYRNFVRDILEKLRHFREKTVIYYTPAEMEDGMKKWLGGSYSFFPQKGKNIGEKMKNAFIEQFKEGFKNLVLIGSDIPHIPPAWIKRAFFLVNKRGAVLGPARDGGYYLIGFESLKFLPEAFDGIDWSGPSVLRSTMAVFDKSSLKPGLLPVMSDIDNPSDLYEVYGRKYGRLFRMPFTADYIKENGSAGNGP